MFRRGSNVATRASDDPGTTISDLLTRAPASAAPRPCTRLAAQPLPSDAVHAGGRPATHRGRPRHPQPHTATNGLVAVAKEIASASQGKYYHLLIASVGPSGSTHSHKVGVATEPPEARSTAAQTQTTRRSPAPRLSGGRCPDGGSGHGRCPCMRHPPFAQRAALRCAYS